MLAALIIYDLALLLFNAVNKQNGLHRYSLNSVYTDIEWTNLLDTKGRTDGRYGLVCLILGVTMYINWIICVSSFNIYFAIALIPQYAYRVKKSTR